MINRRFLLLAFAILVATVASVMPARAHHPCPMTVAQRFACFNDCKLVCNNERFCTEACRAEHCLC
jgi:hypothetical protein